MTEKSPYHISRDDIAREIHRALLEIHPDRDFPSGRIIASITCIDQSRGDLAFNAAAFAGAHDLEPDELLNRLYHELEIEYEKNLHDKFLFEMSRDNRYIYFRPTI